MEEAIRIFFNQYFRCQVFTKDRNKEAMDRKRLVAIFLLKEIKLPLHMVAKIMDITSPSVISLSGEQVDRGFETYYHKHIETLSNKFSEFRIKQIQRAKETFVLYC